MHSPKFFDATPGNYRSMSDSAFRIHRPSQILPTWTFKVADMNLACHSSRSIKSLSASVQTQVLPPPSFCSKSSHRSCCFHLRLASHPMLCYSLPARDDCRNAATFPLGSVCGHSWGAGVSAGSLLRRRASGQPLDTHLVPATGEMPSFITFLTDLRSRSSLSGNGHGGVDRVSSCLQDPACLAHEMCNPYPNAFSYSRLGFLPNLSNYFKYADHYFRRSQSSSVTFFWKISIRLLCLAWLGVALVPLRFILLFLASRGWKNIVVLDPACLTLSFFNI